MRRSLAALISVTTLFSPAAAAVLTGPSAYADWRSDAPGVARRITPADLPPPNATHAAIQPPTVVARPAGAQLHVPPGFTVTEFARLHAPRLVRVSPTGDVFVAESEVGRITVLRAADGAPVARETSTFAAGLDRPYGIAFYPLGPDPQWLYVAETNRVVRFPYRNGDLKARGPAQTIVPTIASAGGNHWTRDVAFSSDGGTMFVSVGSASNDAESMPKKSGAKLAAWVKGHALGAAWGRDEDRADVLAFAPDGKGRRVYATGVRNCAGMAVNPLTKALWCSTNERDLLGDNLPPDYVTRIRPGAFYGWPWYYIGDHEDPRHEGERPDLAGKIAIPDVLIQPHSAPLGMTFYPAGSSGPAAFPQAYVGQAFVALHGSWDRALRTGYKVVVVRIANGRPTGEYDDFLTGFVIDQHSVWGRPVGVAAAHDGALLVADDGGDIVWRVAHVGR